MQHSGAMEAVHAVAALDLRLVLLRRHKNRLQWSSVSRKVNNLQTIGRRGCEARWSCDEWPPVVKRSSLPASFTAA